MSNNISNKEVAKGIFSSLLRCDVEFTESDMKTVDTNTMDNCRTLFSKIYFDNGFNIKNIMDENQSHLSETSNEDEDSLSLKNYRNVQDYRKNQEEKDRIMQIYLYRNQNKNEKWSEVLVKCLTGKFQVVEIEPDDTVGIFKTKLDEFHYGLPLEYKLICNGKKMIDDDLVYNYMGPATVIHFVPNSRGGGCEIEAKRSRQQVSKQYSVNVHTPDGKILKLYISIDFDNLHYLKYLIEKETQIDPSKQKLIFNSKELTENMLKLRELNIYGIGENLFLVIDEESKQTFNLFDKSILDPRYDYDFTDIVDVNAQFMRGGKEYKRPCGWKRIALKVRGKYEDDVWLGRSNKDGEWPVAYHGSDYQGVHGICFKGFDMSKCKREMFGKAHYTTPFIEIAEKFAKVLTINGHRVRFVIQSRVNPKNLLIRNDGKYWLLPNNDDLRPYGLCYKIL